MKTSPTQRSLKKLRDAGYLAAVVEHFNPHAQVRQDLFGIADIMACKPGILGPHANDVLFVQACVIDRNSDHVKKLRGHKNIRAVLDSGIRVEVWAWRKLKKDGWQPKITEIA